MLRVSSCSFSLACLLLVACSDDGQTTSLSAAEAAGAGGSVSEVVEPSAGQNGISTAGTGGSGGAGVGGDTNAAGSGGDSGSGGEAYTEDPGNEGDGDITIGPNYSVDPDLEDQGNPKGQRFSFRMRLADSEIFKGDDSTLDPNKEVRTERRVVVYIPAAYEDGTAAPILIMHDGPGRLQFVANALDNLTISRDPERSLPPFVAIGVENGGGDGKGSERGLEYDTMSDREARFINDEVLPAILNDAAIRAAYPNFAITENPWGRGVFGCSSGGAASMTMGWFRPDLFRRIITYSGTFADQQDDDAPEEAEYPLGAWEYHSGLELIKNSEVKPLRISLHASENDNNSTQEASGHHNLVMANRRMAEDLGAKGYHYRFVYSLNTRHCDPLVFQQTLADTLVWMWRGYHAE